jgi:hypothetical protein
MPGSPKSKSVRFNPIGRSRSGDSFEIEKAKARKYTSDAGVIAHKQEERKLAIMDSFEDMKPLQKRAEHMKDDKMYPEIMSELNDNKSRASYTSQLATAAVAEAIAENIQKLHDIQELSKDAEERKKIKSSIMPLLKSLRALTNESAKRAKMATRKGGSRKRKSTKRRYK